MQCLKTADSELIYMEIISATSALDADLAAKFHYKKKQTNKLFDTDQNSTNHIIKYSFLCPLWAYKYAQ